MVKKFRSKLKKRHFMIRRLRSVQHKASPLHRFYVQLQFFSRGSAMSASRYLSERVDRRVIGIGESESAISLFGLSRGWQRGKEVA